MKDKVEGYSNDDEDGNKKRLTELESPAINLLHRPSVRQLNSAPRIIQSVTVWQLFTYQPNARPAVSDRFGPGILSADP